MKVLVVGNAHLFRARNGAYYSTSVYSYEFLKRYLEVFDSVRFAGKTRLLETIDPQKCMRVDGPGVEIYEIPWYQGMKQMAKKFFPLRKAFRGAMKDCDCVIFRIAQLESFAVYLSGGGRLPFAVEVVNDPETFAPGMIQRFSVFMVKRMTSKACGAAYVTKHFLQLKYPSKMALTGDGHYFESCFSSIDLDSASIATNPKSFEQSNKARLVHVSNAINDDAKGHTTLLKAVKRCQEMGFDATLTCIGDGSRLEEYKELANRLGISDRVAFLGRITNKEDIFRVLRDSDIFVLPTKMEGLPRTVIEAMAAGLPCLSTPIAGIPELIEEKYLFDPSDHEGFASEICRLFQTPSELEQMSKQNICIAKTYSREQLQPRRREFYGRLRDAVVAGRE